MPHVLHLPVSLSCGVVLPQNWQRLQSSNRAMILRRVGMRTV